MSLTDLVKSVRIPLAIASAVLSLGTSSMGEEVSQQQEQSQSIDKKVESKYPTMNHIKGQVNLKGNSVEEYSAHFKKILDRSFPDMPKGPGYDMLIENIGEKAENGKGKASAFFFNAGIDDYNTYAKIAQAIDERNFPIDFSSSLKKYYATLLLKEGYDIDLSITKKEIDLIPNNSTFVKINEGDKIDDIISKYSIDVDTLTKEQRNAALGYVYSSNHNYISGDIDDNNNFYINFRHSVADSHNNDIIIAIPSKDFLKDIANKPAYVENLIKYIESN